MDKLLNKRYAALYPQVFVTYRKDTGGFVDAPLLWSPPPHPHPQGWTPAAVAGTRTDGQAAAEGCSINHTRGAMPLGLHAC